MNGFRQLGIRWWRRQLLCTYVDWKEFSNTVTSVSYQQGKLVKFKVTSDKAAKVRPSRKYIWAKGHGCNTGQIKYQDQLQRELNLLKGISHVQWQWMG